MIWLFMETQMIHRVHYNFYVASDIESGGVYHYRMDASGDVFFISRIVLPRPQYMCVQEDKLYVTLRAVGEDGFGAVTVIHLDPDGALLEEEGMQSTYGLIPCHLCVKDGTVYVANYNSGSAIELPDRLIEYKGGSACSDRQMSAHPHFVNFTPDGKYLYIVDLGMDAIMVYDKALRPFSRCRIPAGHGPRHMAFDDSGSVAFCANELMSTITILDYNDGIFTARDTVRATGGDTSGNAPAAIRFKDDFVYVSNRGRDSVSSFYWDKKTLSLHSEIPSGGECPRDFIFLGEFLICGNQESDNVTFFQTAGGTLMKTCTELAVPKPVCITGEEIRIC